MQDWLPSCAEDFLTYAHSLTVYFCIDWVDASEVLLKVILGLNIILEIAAHIYYIPLHTICTSFASATSLRSYKHWSGCGCNVATVLAKSCCIKSIPCYAPYGPGQCSMCRWGIADGAGCCCGPSRRTCWLGKHPPGRPDKHVAHKW